MMRRCDGLTASGARCEREVHFGGFCYQHRRQGIEAAVARDVERRPPAVVWKPCGYCGAPAQCKQPKKCERREP